MNCIILCEQKIYDFINLGHILYLLSLKYNCIFLVIKQEYAAFCQNYFFHLHNLFFLIISEKDALTYENYSSIIQNSWNESDYYIKYSENFIQECKHILLGKYDLLSWNKYDEKIYIDSMPINYFEIMYKQYNLHYHQKIVNKYWYKRDLNKENQYFQQAKKEFPEGYIFMYDVNIENNFFISKNNQKKIFDGSLSPKYEWNQDSIKEKNVMLLLKIIEEAEELHIGNLEILILCTILDLSHISKKYMYSKKIFLKKYFPMLQSWQQIYI